MMRSKVSIFDHIIFPICFGISKQHALRKITAMLCRKQQYKFVWTMMKNNKKIFDAQFFSYFSFFLRGSSTNIYIFKNTCKQCTFKI